MTVLGLFVFPTLFQQSSGNVPPKSGLRGVVPNTSIDYCRRSAEKALKGYLTFRDPPLECTHHLEHLLELAVALDPVFAPLATQVVVLNPPPQRFGISTVSETCSDRSMDCVGCDESVLVTTVIPTLRT